MRTFFGLSLFVLFVFAGDCLGPTYSPPAKRYYIIRIDSVQLDQTVNLGDTVTLSLWGVIGPDLCYGLYNYDAQFQPLQLDLTAWGVYPAHQYMCAQVVNWLRGDKFSFVPSAGGLFNIVIHEPDGSTLAYNVSVQ